MTNRTTTAEAGREESSEIGRGELEKHDRDGAAAAAATTAATVTVVVLGGTHDAGVGGLRLTSRGMRIVGLRGGGSAEGGFAGRVG